jgi:hypothetical protein
LDNLEVNCDAVECDCCTNSDCSIPIDDPLLELILSLSPGSLEALQDETSPQFRALEWLRSPLNNAFLSDSRRIMQRFALATFYQSLGGDDWEASFLWLTAANECSWHSTSDADPVCNGDGNYVNIDLRNNKLRGSLPREILLLSDTLGE